MSLKDDERVGLYQTCENFEKLLKEADVRVKGDYRENYSPGYFSCFIDYIVSEMIINFSLGWKFNHWELKGVPIRIEIGPRDVKSQQFVAVR